LCLEKLIAATFWKHHWPFKVDMQWTFWIYHLIGKFQTELPIPATFTSSPFQPLASHGILCHPMASCGIPWYPMELPSVAGGGTNVFIEWPGKVTV